MSLYEDPRFQALMGSAWRPGGESLTRRGVELCAWPAGALLADVGCGPGGTSRLLRGLGYRVLSLDRQAGSPASASAALAEGAEIGEGAEMAASALSRTGTTTPLPRMVQADAAALPLPPAALDGVVCECVLSLLPEPDRAVQEFARVLRPGGRALLSDVTSVTRQRPSGSPTSCADGALHPEQIAAWCAAAGLRVLVAEDHRAAMRRLAAQLAWHGIGCGAAGGGALGYHLWIVEKDAL